MKSLKFLPFILLLLFSTCKKDSDEIVQTVHEDNYKNKQIELLTPEQINALIDESINLTGDFFWNNADDILLWSGVIHGDSILTVGYGTKAYVEENDRSQLEIKNRLVERIRNLEGVSDKSDILYFEDEILTVIDLKVYNLETIQELRNDPDIRYLEASGYEYFKYSEENKSSSGCDKSSDAINSNDYRLISPNCYVSWVYDEHNIPTAWTLSTGQGITVGLIDTGVSPEQSLLGSNFNDGYSSGRTIYKYGTYVDSWWPWSTKTDGPNDKCSHGTSMASNISSPRNNNYMPVGVAYNCNLVSYRGTSDVVLDGYHEQKGVANALTALGNRSDVKIISMSIGHIFSINRIIDAVRYANNRGKLIFAAGGTSTTWTNFVGVIFPASMPETVAVTGITDAGTYEECEVCHKGDEIDFTVVMQRDWDGGRTSPTTGFYENTKQYVGGSSVSTSTMAGIAALVWSRHPSWTKDQILNRLKESAEFYPNRHSDFGWGSVDAYLAVQ